MPPRFVLRTLVAALALLVLSTGAWASEPASHSDESATEVQAAGDQHSASDEHVRPGEAGPYEALESDHGGEHGNGNEPVELPSLTMVLRQFVFHDEEGFIHYSHMYENIFYMLLAGIFLSVVARRIYARRTDIPGRLQSFAELLIEQVLNITCTMMGEKDGRKYAPFVATLFVYILVMNYSGLIPLGKAPTSTFLNNISLGIAVFVYVQYTGIRRNGILGYLHHLAGAPQDLVGWMLSPLMFFLEVVGELIKPLSLSLRLFGNIFGEDMLLAVFAILGTVVLSATGLPIGIPFHLPFMFLSLMMGAIQALVFSLLAAVYIALMLPHDHDHAEAH
jgi:F-type H+-transporting ATPase subunit a